MELDVAVVGFAALALCGACQLQTNAAAENRVRQRVEAYSKAVANRDLEGVMSFYAPDVVSFDVNPPLRYAGKDNKRRAWQEFFAAYSGDIAYEPHELTVTAQGELAFVHSVNQVSGTLANGQPSRLWVRWTACLQRIDGVWWVVHDHVSVPADLKHGTALLNLSP